MNPPLTPHLPLFQVLGSSGKLYTCYSSCHFCTCPAFGFSVLQKSESLLVSSLPQPGAAMGRGDRALLPEPQNSKQTPVWSWPRRLSLTHCAIGPREPQVWGAGRVLGAQQWWGGCQEPGSVCQTLHGTVLVAELGTLSTTCARREPRSWEG